MPMEISTWPQDQPYLRPIVAAYMFFVLVAITHMLSSRIGLTGFRRLLRVSFARKLLLLVLFDSWLFVYTSCVVLFGVGASISGAACSVAIWWCVLLYGSSKVVIYTFLVERLFIVHKETYSSTLADRLRNRWFVIGLGLLSLWLAGAITMIVGRISHIRNDGACIIGLAIWTDITIVIIDFVVNSFLTAGFVVPVVKCGFRKSKAIVRRSLVISIVSFAVSATNIIIMSLMKGHQRVYFCLCACITDVCVNAFLLYLLTGSKEEASQPSPPVAPPSSAPRDISHFSNSSKTSKTNLGVLARIRQSLDGDHHAPTVSVVGGVHVESVQHTIIEVPEPDEIVVSWEARDLRDYFSQLPDDAAAGAPHTYTAPVTPLTLTPEPEKG